MKVAICGYGVVGQGVVDILDSIMPGKVKYIFTKEVVEDSRYIKDVNRFLEDEEVGIVIETMGGVDFAFDVLSKSLKHKKHIITSNKALVAAKGSELHELAKENGVNFFFEASVGGGIPLISTMRHGLSHEPMVKVQGILNGTTNYILTLMRDEGISFEEALKDAQDKGFAEKDPTDDVKAYDAARKIAIIGSILTGKTIQFESVPTRGIDEVNETMIASANKNNERIRLIATLEFKGDKVEAWVEPTLVTKDHPFYAIDGVDNAVLFTGKYVGDVLVKGAGAGRYPTASAVVSDVVACDEGIVSKTTWTDEVQEIMVADAFVRVLDTDEIVRKSEVEKRPYLRVVTP